jgi:hypothetical protein
MKYSSLAAAAALTLTFTTTPAAAQVFPGLYNTGTDATNTALASDGLVDPHYVVISSTSGGVFPAPAFTYTHPAYAANDADSRWISLGVDGGPGNNTTQYRLTFDLTGYDPATAFINGLWGADNSATMFLNGVDTGNQVFDFGSLYAFSLTSGFVSGLNVLDFFVTDAGPPTALRVDGLSGQAALANGAVPEPATWAMMLLGFGAIGFTMRRRRAVEAIA